MKYEDCKYLKISNYNPNYKEYYLNVKFIDRYLPIIAYSTDRYWHNTKSFRNYLPYLRMYKQRIIDNVRQGNYGRASKYYIDLLNKTEKNCTTEASDSNYLPSSWAKLIEQLYIEVVKFNVEYKEAYLESQIRNS